MLPKRTLLLTEREIRTLLSPKEYLSLAESAFRAYGKGEVILPSKLYLTLPKGIGDFRAMPAYLASPGRCGLKWVNVHVANERHGFPTVMALILLNDVQTGFPLAILDGTWITKMRTGAGGGVAAKFLARKESSVLGLVGCGAQAETQLLFLSRLFRFRKIKFWGLRTSEQNRFLKKLKGEKYPLEAKGTIRETVLDVDILVTTTPSRRPLVRREWVKPGTHINAIGADAKGKEELDVALLKEGKVVVDDWHQASEGGEINVPFSKRLLKKRDIHATLGEIVCGFKKGRERREEITIFDATGLAIQDIAVAWEIYRKADRHGMGRKIRFF